MGKKLDIVLEVQEPKRENNTSLDFYITSGEILISDEYEHFMPHVFVNGKKYSEYFLENLRVAIDSKKKGWPEYLPFRLIWDKDDKKKLKGITAYYDFLVFRKDGYFPEGGMSIKEALQQKVHFEIEKEADEMAS